MNWKTLVALPFVGLIVWGVIAAISFGERVGDSWSDTTTTTVTNGLVMVCFGSAMFGVFILSLIIGVALASRLLAQPVRSEQSERGAERGSWLSRRRPSADYVPPGWGDDVVDSYGQPGRIVSIEAPAGARPMLPPQGFQEPAGYLAGPPASGAFDGMEDGNDQRFRMGG